MSEQRRAYATFGLSEHPLDVQVGGDHYKTMAIQPVEFIQRNGLGFCDGNVIKYVCRRKGNRVQDLKKARHYLDILISYLEANQVDQMEQALRADPTADQKPYHPNTHPAGCRCVKCDTDQIWSRTHDRSAS